MKIQSIKKIKETITIPASLPDIDTDSSSKRAPEIKNYITEKYGKDNTCWIGSYGQLSTKSKIQALLRAIGVPQEDQIRITKSIPVVNGVPTVENLSDLIQLCTKKKPLKYLVKKYSAAFHSLDNHGGYKSLSKHAAAVIVTPTKDEFGNDVSIHDFIPCYKDADGVIISQTPGKWLDGIGVLKNDILAISELDKMERTLELIEEQYQEKIDVEKIPMDDPKVSEEFAKGNVQQIFQFNGDGMASLLKRMIPKNMQDLSAANALYRPGPMGTNMHIDYCLIKNGEKNSNAIPILKELCKDTYSLPVFQEQILTIFQVVAGYSLQESDNIRRYLGKKLVKELEQTKPEFLERASRVSGLSQEDAIDLWDTIEYFSGYSFNKCISGEEILFISKKDGSSAYMKVSELYKEIQNKKYSYITESLNLNTFKVVSNEIIDIRYEGKKQLYEVTCDPYAVIKTTINHKFPTTNGIKELGRIDINKDQLYRSEIEDDIQSVDNVKIVSILPADIEDVYDIEMKAPYHNFSNYWGLFTCNSHSLAYAVTGYWGMWLKIHYPMAFWSGALGEESKTETIQRMIREVSNSTSQNIEFLGCDVNKSSAKDFQPNFSNNTIVASLNSVAQIAEKGAEQIMNDRKENGEFISFKEFVARMLKYTNKEEKTQNAVRSNGMLNLIYAGGFDDIEGCVGIVDRNKIIEQYNEIYKPKEKDEQIRTDYTLLELKQLQIKYAKIGTIPYKELFNKYKLIDPLHLEAQNEGDLVYVAGTLKTISLRERKTTNVITIELEETGLITEITAFNKEPNLKGVLKQLNESIDCVVLLQCSVKYNAFQERNRLYFNHDSNPIYKILK